MIGHLFLAFTTFVVTNLDDLLILSFYFALNSYSTRSIVSGQYLGISFLILVSFSGLLFKNIIPEHWIALLGVFPIVIGIKELSGSKGKEEIAEDAKTKPASNQIYKIALVTIANGGDNIGVYTPLFANTKAQFVWVYPVIFLFLTGVWCFMGYYFVNHPRTKSFFLKYSSPVMPYFLILLGLYILKDFFLQYE